MNERYGHMAHHRALARVAEILREREARLAALRTRKQAERYVMDVRAAAARAFGPLPRRTPLEPVLGPQTELGRSILQPMTFQSRPGFTVTGDLYLPRAGKPPYPAVVGLCGHALEGKAAPFYQAFCQGLAAKGFLVLIIDPISQGERVQFLPADLDAVPARGAGPLGAGLQSLPGLCDGHNVMGNQQALLGDFFGSWRVWDAIRAVDYLLSRDDVDPDRVGVTGNSGGGTLSTWLTALEPRLAMAAPSCFVCSFGSNLENEIPSDAEQNPPGIIRSGLDQVDLLLCYAPRPTLLLSQRDDFFDTRAAERAAAQMRRVHELLGSKGTAAFFRGPRPHGYSQENREAMYKFFLKVARVRGDGAEPELAPQPPEKLNASGGMAPGRRVFDFIRDEADRLASLRGAAESPEIERMARAVLGLAARRPASTYYCLTHARHAAPELRHQSVFAVQSEPGISVIVSTYGPEQDLMHPPRGQLVAYVGHASGERDVQKVEAVRALTAGTIPLAVIEPRGFGATRDLSCNSKRFLEPYGSDYLLACTGEMLGESYLGRRVHDALCALDFLVAGGADRIELVGRGLGAVIAAFAGLLHASAPKVRLLDYLPSFDLLCRDPLANWPLSSLPRGVLKRFDLPDVYRALGGRLELGAPAGSRLDPAEMP